MTAQSLLGRPGLQVLRQIAYESGNEQKNRPQFVDINFSVGGKEGIRLPDAMDRIFDGPDGRDELMFTNENIGSSISCRIIVSVPCAGDRHSSSIAFISLKGTVLGRRRNRCV